MCVVPRLVPYLGGRHSLMACSVSLALCGADLLHTGMPGGRVAMPGAGSIVYGHLLRAEKPPGTSAWSACVTTPVGMAAGTPIGAADCHARYVPQVR